MVRGAQRFFVVCDEKWHTEVQAAVADYAGAALFTDADAALAAAVDDLGFDVKSIA